MQFVIATYSYDNSEGFGGPLAKTVSGNIERRSPGDVRLQPAKEGTELYNLDAIWVGQGALGVLELKGGTLVEIEENSYIVLKNSFKGGGLPHEKIKVVSGRVKVRSGSNDAKVIEPPPTFTELPTSRQRVENVSGAKSGIQPAPGIKLAGRLISELDVHFAWPKPTRGYLVVSREEGGTAIYQELDQGTQAKVRLVTNRSYFWKILDENRNTLYGPFQFELLSYSDDDLKKLIREKPAIPIQVIWN